MSSTRVSSSLLPLTLLAGIVLAWATILLVVLATAGTDESRSGTLLAVFPRGTAEREVLAKVAMADGVVVRGTWLGPVWQVHGEAEGFAGSLRAQGALWVLPPLPYDLFGMGGCGFGMAPPQRRRTPIPSEGGAAGARAAVSETPGKAGTASS